MWMVALLARRFFHGPITRHGQRLGAKDGVQIGSGCVLKNVFGEQTPVSFHPHFAGLLGDLNLGFRGYQATANKTRKPEWLEPAFHAKLGHIAN